MEKNHHTAQKPREYPKGRGGAHQGDGEELVEDSHGGGMEAVPEGTIRQAHRGTIRSTSLPSLP